MNNIQDKKYFDDVSEAIKVYEEFRKYKNGDFIETIDPDFFFNLTDCIITNYNTLKRENEELKEQLEYDKTHIFTQMTINLNYISKQKIKDKIEEIKEDKESRFYYDFLEERDIEKTIDILQELLKESEDK